MPVIRYETAPLEFIWYGYLSSCRVYGNIIRFVLEYLENTSDYYYLAAPCCDGVVSEPHPRNLTIGEVANEYYKDQARNSFKTSKLIFTCLSTRNYYAPEIVLLPLDDNSFKYGVYEQLEKQVTFISWEQKKPIAFWRGSGSGFPQPNIRGHTVLSLRNNPNSDVKFIKDAKIEELPDEELYSDRVHIQEFLKYKYLLIIDGTVISSSLQWTFASGSVPILITHPGNNWWFKKYLVPMIHYVPIAYDLSDLESQIQWLIDNDDKAREIAENAVKFSKEYLSAEAQQKYLAEELNRGIHV